MIAVRGVVLWACCAAAMPVGAQAVALGTDLSQCENCDVFPEEFLRVDPETLIDLTALPPERRLDFLIGEWELIFPLDDVEQGIHYTVDQPIGFEIVDWFVKDQMLEAFQEWPFTSGGGLPFRSKMDFRYVQDEQRWQLTWLTTSSFAIYTGGLEDDGVFAFYEHEWTGDHHNLEFRKGPRYVFRNITPDSYLAEYYESDDGGETYEKLLWRLQYRRRPGS